MTSINFKVVQTPAIALYQGLSIVGTSAVIAPYPTDLDGNKLTMGDFGTVGRVTVDSKVSGYEEICDFTGMVDNGNNTCSLTGLGRDLISKYPYNTYGTGKLHGAGASVVFSNNPQMYSEFAALRNDETISGLWSFTTSPTVPTPTTASQAAPKSYVDGVVIAGGVDASTTTKGISELTVNPVLPATPIAVGANDPQFVNYFSETGVANAFVITPSPSIGAYAVGQRFSFKSSTLNTGASTININGLGAKTIKKLGGATDLVAGDIIIGQIVSVEYDGTNFQMISTRANTVDLVNGKVPTSFIDVGTGANQLVQLDSSGKLPAVDGSSLTSINSSTSGLTTRNAETASGVQNIPHGLGVIPKKINLFARFQNGPLGSGCVGVKDQGGQTCIWYETTQVAAGIGSSTSFAIYIITNSTDGYYSSGVVTADATNIIITWTRTQFGIGGGTTPYDIMWQASK